MIIGAQMPMMDDIEATRRIKRDFPGISILFLSTSTDYIQAARTAECDGHLNKDYDPKQLYAEVRRIVESRKSSEQRTTVAFRDLDMSVTSR